MNFSKALICGIVILNTSCGLINGELLRPLQKTDLGSTTPVTPPSSPATPSTPPATSPVIAMSDSWGISWQTKDLVLKGSYAVAGGSRGLAIYDITNPYDLTLVNTVKNTSVRNITSVNDYAFVSYENGNIELLNIANPWAPVLLDGLTLTSPGRVITQGSIAYVPDGASGLRVLDFSDPSNLQLVNTIDTDGTATVLTIEGTYLYLSDGATGMKIFDLAIPTAPILSGGLLTSSTARGITVKGNYVYVGTDWGGIDIFDVSNKATPSLVANYHTPHGFYNNYFALEIQDNILIALEEENGFVSLDISNPTAPTYLGNSKPFATNWFAIPQNLARTATHAFIATDYYGITTVDISNLSNPFTPYTFEGDGWYANSIDATTTRAFVCENDWGVFSVLDITNQSHPVLLGSLNTVCDKEIIYDNNMVYIASGNAGMSVIDVSDPTAPVKIGSFDSGNSARSVAKLGNYVYMTYLSGTYIYDVTTPSAPTLKGSILVTSNDVAVDGNYAYIAGNDTLRIYNISNPASPTLVVTYNFPSGTTTTYKIHKSGNYIFVAGSYQWAIIDVSTPATPTLVKRETLADTPSDLTVLGNKLFICDYNSGVFEFDISDFNNIKRTAIYHSQCLGVTARNGNLFIADEESGMKILNSSSKPFIDVVNKTSRNSSGRDITISDNKAFLYDGYFGTIMFDITNPTKPTYLTRLNLGFTKPRYEVLGTILYATDKSGIFGFDISTPSAPTPLSSLPVITPGNPILQSKITGNTLYTIEGTNTGVLGVYNLATTPGKPTFVTSVAAASMESLYISGNLLFAANGTLGLRIFDISTPLAPVQLSLYDTAGTAIYLYADGNYVYLSEGTSGVRVIDVSNPSSPSAVGIYDTPGYAGALAKKDSYLFVADAYGGLQVLDVSTPASPTLKTNISISVLGSNANGLAIEGNYLHVDTGYSYEIFDISDINNIHQ